MTTGITQTMFAQSLARYTGLAYTAALAWASAEVGSLNNLGIMSGGQPVSYPTPDAGAKAAAALIASSSNYAGIRASVGKSVQAQMDAIARSPWHLGGAGLAAAGGIDPWYVKVFKQFGYVPGASTTTSATSTSSGAGSSSSAPGATISKPIAFGKFFREAYKKTSPAKLDAGNVDGWANATLESSGVGGTGPFGIPFGTPGTADYQAKIDATKAALVAAGSPYIGTEYGKLPETITISVPAPLTNGLTDAISGAVGGVFDGLSGALGGVLVNGAVLVLILVLAYSGLDDLLGQSAQ